MPSKKRFVFGKHKSKGVLKKKKSFVDHDKLAVDVELHKHDINDNLNDHQEINVNSVDPLSLLPANQSHLNKQQMNSSEIHVNNEINKFECSYWDDESLFTLNEECKNKDINKT